MRCKFVLIHTLSALTPSKALRGKLSVLHTGVFLQLRPKAILPPETCRSLASLEMMILSTFTVLFLMSERIKSWSCSNNKNHACASEASDIHRKDSFPWHEQLKVQVALPDTRLAKLCRYFILRRSESTKKWEETCREGLISAEEHRRAWEVQLGRQLVLGDDLQGKIPVRNTPETGCSYVAGNPC